MKIIRKSLHLNTWSQVILLKQSIFFKITDFCVNEHLKDRLQYLGYAFTAYEEHSDIQEDTNTWYSKGHFPTFAGETKTEIPQTC